ncbi:hypothetical protein J0910_14690 [Nocardiopsis sp. CNT-189]|uniref:hypothetical protein n=1 Tax=Nocardiopsis oceanisediminis TaxID=2816862 RepID=UPI003B2D2382
MADPDAPGRQRWAPRLHRPGADPAAGALRERLGEVLVGGEFAEVAEVRAGRRAPPADGLTVCGFADPGARLYTIATHSGITPAPIPARWAAEEILDGAEQPARRAPLPGAPARAADTARPPAERASPAAPAERILRPVRPEAAAGRGTRPGRPASAAPGSRGPAASRRRSGGRPEEFR